MVEGGRRWVVNYDAQQAAVVRAIQKNKGRKFEPGRGDQRRFDYQRVSQCETRNHPTIKRRNAEQCFG